MEGHGAVVGFRVIGCGEGIAGEESFDLIGSEATGEDHFTGERERVIAGGFGGDGVGVIAELEFAPASAVAEVVGCGLIR